VRPAAALLGRMPWLLPWLLPLGAAAAPLRLVAFDGAGPPPAGTRAQVAGAEHVLDADGALTLDLPPGTHTLTVLRPDGRPWATVALALGEAPGAEALLRLPAEGEGAALVLDLAAAGGPGPTAPAGAARGLVRGVVRDEQGRPVEGAQVFARGAAAEARTDAEGRFTLEAPVGPLGLAVLRPGFAARPLPPAELRPDAPLDVEVTLVEAGLSLGAYTVTAPRIEGGTAALLDERQQGAQVVDTLSAEEMRRRGDSSAASALRRVTGITVVGGRYVYVRGLGERYSATLLNGSAIPSPEPERRVVPLDLFPTALLEGVVVQKTASPDMPAEFGGGVVQLRTRGIPDAPLLRVGVTGSWNSVTTGQTGLLTAPVAGDAWAKGAAGRGLPAAFAQAIDDTPLVVMSALPGAEGFSPEQLAALGASLPNRWGLRETVAGPDRSATLEGGRGFRIGQQLEVGGLAGLVWREGWQRADYREVFYRQNSGALEIQNDFQFLDLTRRVQVGGMAVAQARWADTQDLRATALLTRDGEDTGRRYIGYYDEVGADIRGERSQYVQRELIILQATGEHRLPWAWDSAVRWRLTRSLADREEPDRRDILMERASGGGWRMRNQGGGNGLFYSELADLGKDRGVDLTVPLLGRPQGEPWAVALSGGASRTYRDREVDTRRFAYTVQTGGEAGATDFLAAEPAQIFDRQNILDGRLRIGESTTATDNYWAVQELQAAYGALALTLPWGLSGTGGLRREDSGQQVTTYQLFTPEPVEEIATLVEVDWLPSGSLTWRITPADAARPLLLRAGAGQTVNRPDFRELSPAVYNDVTGGREVVGNPDLERARLLHRDLRLEWYPSPDELLSAGVFDKRFEDPIESTIVVSANSRVSAINAVGARSAGLELELRKRLGPPGHALEPLVASGNFAWIQSEVDLGAAAAASTRAQRPLQGQSPTTVNAGLGWEPPEGRLAGALSYNAAGPRIAQVGEGGMPDVYATPPRQLDLAAALDLPAGFQLSARAQNLLDSPEVLRVGDRVARSWSAGRTYTLGLRWGLEAEAAER